MPSEDLHRRFIAIKKLFSFRTIENKQSCLEILLSNEKQLTELLNTSFNTELRNLNAENALIQRKKCIEAFSNLYCNFETILEKEIRKSMWNTDYGTQLDVLETKLEWKSESRIDNTIWEEVRQDFDTLLVGFHFYTLSQIYYKLQFHIKYMSETMLHLV